MVSKISVYATLVPREDHNDRREWWNNIAQFTVIREESRKTLPEKKASRNQM